MPVDYAAYARKFGGTVVEDEPDYSSLASMKPMVAHTPRAQAVDYAAMARKFGGQAVEPEREAINYRGLRMVRQGSNVAVQPEPTDEERAALAGQTATVATGAAMGAGAMLGGPAVPAAVRVLAGPGAQAAIAGGVELARGGSVPEAIWEGTKAAAYAEGGGALVGAAAKYLPKGVGKSVFARIAHLIGRAGKAEPAAEEAVAKAAPAVAKAVTPAAEEAVPAVTLARKVKPIPSDPGVAARAAERRARQEAAARASGLDIAEVFGTKAAAPVTAAPAARAEQAVESALETRLRASVLMKENPKALTDEVVDRVVSIKTGVGKGLSAAQVADSIEELYGFKPSVARQMVDMIFKDAGLR